MDLSIIILNYNTKEITKQTVESVINTTKNIDYEIFLLDNGSSDGSIEFFQEEYEQALNINLIFNDENLGFSKANNQAIKKAKGKYVLLLNSDTIVKEECIVKCMDYMDKHPQVGALGPKIVLADGSLDHACKRGFPTPSASLYYILNLEKFFPKSEKFGRYRMSHLSNDEINEVDALTGAFMMVRKEVVEKIGALDERFFMYGEDLDWCYRIKEAGWKIIYYPESLLIHLKGQSSRKKRRYKTIYQFHKTMLQFYNKHYLKKYNIFVTAFVYFGVILKMGLSFVINFIKGIIN